MSRYVAEIDARVCGIPCKIGVLCYEPYSPAYLYGPPERCFPAEGGYGDYELLDKRGRRAQWLEKKIDSNEEIHIQEQIFDALEGR